MSKDLGGNGKVVNC